MRTFVKKQTSLGSQLNFRLSNNLFDRLEEMARRLGVDKASIIRELIQHGLSTYHDNELYTL